MLASTLLPLLLILSALVPPQAAQITQFNTTLAPDRLADDNFGFSVTTLGSLMAVGATNLDYNSTVTNIGAAYLMNCTGFPCTPTLKFLTPDPKLGDTCGYSVALSETLFAMGCRGVSSGSLTYAGAVYLYSYNQTDSVLISKIFASAPAASEYFGYSVTLTGSLLVVGAPSTGTGAAYIFSVNETSVTFVAKLSNSTAGNLGRSVASSGSLLVIGADGTKVGTNTSQGIAIVYNCSAASCTPKTIIKGGDGKASMYFGSSVAVEGEMVAVGAREANGVTTNTGAAYVFKCPLATLSCTQMAKLYAPDGAIFNYFGFSISIYDSLVAVGDYVAGGVYLWDCLNFSCRYVGKIAGSSSAQFGFSVNLRGWNVLVGANLATVSSVKSGAVYLFDATAAICSCSSANSLNPATCSADRQCTCKPGWQGKTCTTDIDECLLGTHGCHSQARCANTQGSFTCSCNLGWVGNGTFCEDANECDKGTHDCQSNAVCTNTIGSFTCACAPSFYGSPLACQACLCGAGSIDGTCDSAGNCACLEGFNGIKCQFCDPGRYGPSCLPCPDCLHGECDEGAAGNGSCLCDERYDTNNAGVCGACLPGHYGAYCEPCEECNAGLCYSGIGGNGTCVCNHGWQDHNSTSRCDDCAPGYAMDEGGECQLCHVTCKTCSGLSASDCLSCNGTLLYEPDLHQCFSNCTPGEYNNTETCAPCHPTCSECSAGGSGSCLSCQEGLIFDFGFCRSSCETPKTFNNNGTCKLCPLTCSACTGEQPGQCTACASNALVFDTGDCVGRCKSTNSYVSEGICSSCNPSCATCSGPSPSNCTSCDPPASLSAGSCVLTCPPKQFSNLNRVCQNCHDTCGACTGSSYQQCTSCDPSTTTPYQEGSTCLTSCPPFKFAPAGSYLCESCSCFNFTTNCDAGGICLNCQGNTSGTNCELCKAGFNRTLPANSTEACADVDECLTGTHSCSPGALCTNTLGSYTCVCKTGYEGNGTFCQDIDECAGGTATCQENATCHNSPGSYACTCDEGFKPNGTLCVPDVRGEAGLAAATLAGVILGSLFGPVIALSLALVALHRMGRWPFRKRDNKMNDLLAEMDLGNFGTSVSLGDPHSANATTMLNTVNEISLPGYLMVSLDKQLRVTKDIAAGGGGTICVAEVLDPRMKEENGGKELVVIKQVTGVSSFDEEDNMTLFQQEVAAMSALRNHRFVATLLGFSNTPKCIIVPLYAGDLHGYIHATDSFQTLPPGHKISYPFQALLAYQIIDAFSVIHTVGIVHRDLKTKNILLEATPEARFPYKVRIADFGICRIVQEQGIKNQNFLNIFGVSVRYAAPEVFSREFLPNATLDAEDEKKTDVYSFAVCLYEMFTAEFPWGEAPKEEIQRRVGLGDRPGIPQLDEKGGDKAIQRTLIDMINLCWNQNPHLRPTFKILLDRIIQNHLVSPFPTDQTLLFSREAN